MTWAPGAGGVLVGTSPEFVIPSGAKLMSVEVVADYDKNGTPASTEVIKSQGIPNEFVVFGAFVPNKLALFDTMGAERRTRVVEGGGVVRGAHAVLSYTDWRLDTVTEKVGMDLRIGQKTSGSRFGPVVVDALGSLEYEVTAAVSTDGGATYNPVAFSKVMHPAVLSAQRRLALRARGRPRHPRRRGGSREGRLPREGLLAGPELLLRARSRTRATLLVPASSSRTCGTTTTARTTRCRRQPVSLDAEEGHRCSSRPISTGTRTTPTAARRPDEYVEFRRSLGMKAIAIADHDVLAGVRAGAIAAERAQMLFIPALEVTAHINYGQSGEEQFHVLCYFTHDILEGFQLEHTAFFRRGLQVQARWKDFVLTWMSKLPPRIARRSIPRASSRSSRRRSSRRCSRRSSASSSAVSRSSKRSAITT